MLVSDTCITDKPILKSEYLGTNVIQFSIINPPQNILYLVTTYTKVEGMHGSKEVTPHFGVNQSLYQRIANEYNIWFLFFCLHQETLMLRKNAY